MNLSFSVASLQSLQSCPQDRQELTKKGPFNKTVFPLAPFGSMEHVRIALRLQTYDHDDPFALLYGSFIARRAYSRRRPGRERRRRKLMNEILEMLGTHPAAFDTHSESSCSTPMTPTNEATTPSNPETPSNHRNGSVVSSGIMRSEQTLMLVQLYHRNHKTMTSCSHDVEGRKTKQQLWAEIASELNTKYETSFSVEQFKKKLQNIQCTARMKIQAEKRNRSHGISANQKYSQAELEFIRLFEHHNAPQNLLFNDAQPTNLLETLGIYADENGYHLGALSSGDSGDSSASLDDQSNANVVESDTEAAQQLLLALGVGMQHNDSGIFDASARSPSEQSDNLDISKLLASTSSPSNPAARSHKRSIVPDNLENIPAKSRRKNVSNGQIPNSHLTLSAAVLSQEERQWRENIMKNQEIILQNQVRFEDLLRDKKRDKDLEERKLAAINSLSERVARLCDILSSFEHSLRSPSKSVPTNGSI
uniref:Regulatory protein zeste n=1 Tax=Steinernema glaseri TaxID=37863 RepID=A0A1I7XY66_9BILA